MDLERRKCEDEQDAWPVSSLGVTVSFLDFSGSLVLGFFFVVERGGVFVWSSGMVVLCVCLL